MDRIPNVCQLSTEKLVDIDMSNENVTSDLLTTLRKKPDIPTYCRLYMGRNKIHIPTHIACRNMVRNIISNP